MIGHVDLPRPWTHAARGRRGLLLWWFVSSPQRPEPPGTCRTPRIISGLVGGGTVVVVLSALVLLTIGARRRGLVWWKWYSAGTTNSP
ncbi:hypothetical protein JOF29_005359 [Kribbella aluminosa]|uniref:Uncharacterized protein n=1 Tax=Kribbella aluminosa TaxID=416017 RepID=A0ABS4URQ7_9ACTN|nr:hypothetical protein [Kribbella aluminosa]